MPKETETREQRLTRLEDELKQLKSTFPEHCYGREGYISVHRASPAHFQKLEDTEDEINKLKAELGKV